MSRLTFPSGGFNPLDAFDHPSPIGSVRGIDMFIYYFQFGGSVISPISQTSWQKNYLEF